MAHFFFHFRSGAEYVEDEEGHELADAEAARAEAVAGLREILASDMLEGVLDTRSSIDVEDENHRPVMTVAFDEAVRLEQSIHAASGNRPHTGGMVSGNDD